jgi:hypothetical protein
MATNIYSSEGIYGFYKGYSVSFYASIIYGLVYFSVYKQSKKTFNSWLNQSNNDDCNTST